VDHCDVVLVGNKADRADDREVLRQAGEAAAKELGCPYLESSAASGENIDAIFASLTQVMLQRHLRERPPGAGAVATPPAAAAGAGAGGGSTPRWKAAQETIDLVDLASRKPAEETPSSCAC